MSYQNVLAENRDGVMWLTVNRPEKLNALNRATMGEIEAVVVSAAAAALLAGYVFVLSSSLPSTDGVVAVGQPAPQFALPDQSGTTVRLADFAGRDLVVVFYRGFW